MRKENHYRINKAWLSVVFALSVFILAPRPLGAFSLAETEQTSAKAMDASTLNKEQFQKPALSSEYQPVYKMNDKVYRLNDAKVLVPLSPQETIQYNQYKSTEIKIEKPDTVLPKIENKVKAGIPVSAKPQVGNAAMGVNKVTLAPEAVNNLLTPPGITRLGDAKHQDQGRHKGWEIGKHLGWDKAKNEDVDKIEKAAGNNLNLLSVGAKTEGKPGQVRNQLKLEGISENPQEEEEIQIVPKIKVEGIYQGSSDIGRAEQKIERFFFNQDTIDRR